jgi:hypothetical protein
MFDDSTFPAGSVHPIIVMTIHTVWPSTTIRYTAEYIRA